MKYDYKIFLSIYSLIKEEKCALRAALNKIFLCVRLSLRHWEKNRKDENLHEKIHIS